MQAQHPSGSGTEATTNPFKVGDKVSFIVSQERGHTVNLSARKGQIVEVGTGMARVKYRNGHKVWVSLNVLTPEGQPNALTTTLLRALK